jgi:hypothetical protein
MGQINYDGRRFRVAESSETSETGSETVFLLSPGGSRGMGRRLRRRDRPRHLIGTISEAGVLDICINT